MAEAYGKVKQADEGLALLAEALTEVHNTGESWWEAEICRLKGELTLMQSNADRSLPSKVPNIQKAKSGEPKIKTISPQAQQEAEVCFHQAIEIARKQLSKSLELRAAISLSRLRESQGRWADAEQILVGTYSWFNEGFETKDLQEAKLLLDRLRSSKNPNFEPSGSST
jgi:predicted ATPase